MRIAAEIASLITGLAWYVIVVMNTGREPKRLVWPRIVGGTGIIAYILGGFTVDGNVVALRAAAFVSLVVVIYAVCLTADAFADWENGREEGFSHAALLVLSAGATALLFAAGYQSPIVAPAAVGGLTVVGTGLLLLFLQERDRDQLSRSDTQQHEPA